MDMKNIYYEKRLKMIYRMKLYGGGKMDLVTVFQKMKNHGIRLLMIIQGNTINYQKKNIILKHLSNFTRAIQILFRMNGYLNG